MWSLRVAAEWLRRTHTESEGPIAPVFGLTCALAITAPLIAGAIVGHDAVAGIIALGAYFIASSGAVVSLDTNGPYGARARLLAMCVLAVTVGSLVGGLLSKSPVAAIIAVPLVAAGSVGFPKIGPSVALAVLIASARPPSVHYFSYALLEAIGGVIVALFLLAPWLTRRLQPLRLSIADAAWSVANLLDLLADPQPADPDRMGQEWSKRRRRALDDIARAQRVYGLYRTSDRAESRRPRRLIEALQRIVGEAGALRDLLPPLQRDRPYPRWERDRRVAVTAIAARLRLLSDSIRTNGETPLVATQPAALGRLGRATERLRRAGLAGDEDILLVALMVQARRVLDRMMNTADVATEVVAGGVRLRPEIKLMPEPTRPTLRGTVTAHLPEARHAMRIWLCVAAAMAVSAGTGVSHGYWLTLTVMISLRGTYGSTVERVAKRVGGTAVGAIGAALALAIAPGQIFLIILIFICVFGAFTLRTRNYAYWMMGNTPLIMLLAEYDAPLDWDVAGIRIGFTVAGSVLALIAARFLWPSAVVPELPDALSDLLSAHARLARTVAERTNAVPDHALLARRLSGAEKAAQEIVDQTVRLGEEPAPPLDEVARLRLAVSAAGRLREHIMTVAVILDDTAPSTVTVEATGPLTLPTADPAAGTKPPQRDVGPVGSILDRLADYLEDGADALSGENPANGTPPKLELDGLLSDLDEHLATLARRRKEEAAREVPAGGAGTSAETTGGSPASGAATDLTVPPGDGTAERTSPLRRSLLQAAGTRYALRSLGSDATELRAAASRVARLAAA